MISTISTGTDFLPSTIFSHKIYGPVPLRSLMWTFQWRSAFPPPPTHPRNNNKQKETKTNQKGPTKKTPYFWGEGSFLDDSSSNFQAESKLGKKNVPPLFLEKQHPNQKAGSNHLIKITKKLPLFPSVLQVYRQYHCEKKINSSCFGSHPFQGRLWGKCLATVPFLHTRAIRSTSFSSSGLQKTATFFWIPRPLGTVTLVLRSGRFHAGLWESSTNWTQHGGFDKWKKSCTTWDV